MTTAGPPALQIAWAKEHLLESALRLITPVITDDEALCVAQDLDGLSQDATNLFAMLLRCDEKHNLLAATSDDYRYQATEEELTVLFRRFLAMSEDLCVDPTASPPGTHHRSSACSGSCVRAHPTPGPRRSVLL